jgi:hypothetical protein
VDDVRGILPLQHHVGAADGVGLGIQLLAEHLQPGLGIQLPQVVLRHREHAARATGRIVQCLDDARLGEQRVVLDEEQADHQPDHLARREVLSGGLVGKLREAADQLLVEIAHLQVGHRAGVQVDVAESRQNHEQEVRLVQPDDLSLELELVQHVPRPRREPGDVGAQVVRHVRGIVEQLRQVERGGVEELLARGGPLQDRVQVLRPTHHPGVRLQPLAFVGSSTQSSRRSTVSGKMTLPYSDCL